ncbi:MAG: hypothetical protein ACRC2R_11450 [Xenococcaceae cyanobacterium]
MVLNISDLLEDRIDAEKAEHFFEENYITAGMQTLIDKAFARLENRNSQASTFLLAQAMGGGKTHSMISLGLLAKYPELRRKILGDNGSGSGVGTVNVIGFNGREADAKFGLWGELAEQLNKKKVFNEHYAPLKAPGVSAWINLLQGEPTLIFLDELPPYLENAKTIEIGSSDLSVATAIAISNLLVAVERSELSNVCVVISDLTASWEGGSGQLNKAVTNLQNETGRSALRLEPVNSQGDELYHILQETFTTLVYPSKNGFRFTDCRIHFQGNHFDGEALIRNTLERVQKFTTDVASETFRKKCEVRLFANQKTSSWNEVKRRAATQTDWSFHHPKALEELKKQMLDREIFLKILTMDADSLWQRCKGITVKSVYEWSSDLEKEKYFHVSGKSIRWNNQNPKKERDRLTRRYFDSLSYDEKLEYCDRPEQIEGASKEAWVEINAHLGTSASGTKKGNYVQGTVLLVLRKRLNDDVAFLDEIYPLIEDEVREQLDKMLAIDDKDAPNFGDTDYQLAAYAAALRVLTQYGEIEGMDIKHELFRERGKSEKSEFEKVIDRAVKIACNHLVPEDFAEFHWKSLTASERLYLKGVELEKHGEFRNGAYQELAKGFGVRDYNFLYAKTKSNEARFKTASEFKRTNLKGDGFDRTLVRHLLFAIHETVSKETVQEGLNYLKVEVPNYWSDRKRSLEILRYLSRLEHIPHLPHWKKDAEAARVLAGAVENDRG